MAAILDWAAVAFVVAVLVVVWRRGHGRARQVMGYAAGAVLVLLGVPLFLGYVGAVFPLVVGVAVLVRTRRSRG